ncbi:MAG: hypothetical protein GVY32_08470 [Gammaproteobacteria bacterium]|jgi:hypothetical protein|nr:hypothetical protein [Gammaproteobacteria bacterium]
MKKLALLLLLAVLAAPAIAQDYEITRWTIASGGTMESTGDDWTLKGTIGQWEATEARELSGGQWRLTGGFWADVLQALADFIFSDRFEGSSGSTESP